MISPKLSSQPFKRPRSQGYFLLFSIIGTLATLALVFARDISAHLHLLRPTFHTQQLSVSRVFGSCQAYPFKSDTWAIEDTRYLETSWRRWEKGRWASSPANFSTPLHPQWLTPPHYSAFPTFTSQQISTCLARKWVLIVGDSSSRILYATLVNRLDPSLMQRPDMPQFNRLAPQPPTDTRSRGQFLKGNTDWEISNGNQDTSYFRELHFKNSKTRLSFVFKTTAAETPVLLSQLLAAPRQPDLLVLQTGAWDRYYKHSAASAATDLERFLESLLGMIDRGTSLVYLNLATVHIPFIEYAKEFNRRTRSMIRKYKIPIFDRTATLPRDEEEETTGGQVEGWHTWSDAADLMLDGFLSGICRR